MELRLYGFWASTCTWRVRIALAHKGLAFDYVPVDLLEAGGQNRTPGFHARNPLEQVPLLEVGRDGSTTRVAQSMAILELLEELVPEPRLLPREPFARARSRQLAEMINSGIQPLQNVGVQRHVKSLGADPHAWARHWVTRGLAALEEQAAESAGEFLVGDAPSFADVCLVPQLFYATRAGFDLAPYPTLVRVGATCSALPAFRAAHAEAQPDAPPPSQSPPPASPATA